MASAVGGGGRVEGGQWRGGGVISPAASLIIVGTLLDHRPGPLRVLPPFPESLLGVRSGLERLGLGGAGGGGGGGDLRRLGILD